MILGRGMELPKRASAMADEPPENPWKGLKLAPMVMDEFVNGSAPMMIDAFAMVPWKGLKPALMMMDGFVKGNALMMMGAPDLNLMLRPALMTRDEPYGNGLRPGNDVTRRT